MFSIVHFSVSLFELPIHCTGLSDKFNSIQWKITLRPFTTSNILPFFGRRKKKEMKERRQISMPIALRGFRLGFSFLTRLPRLIAVLHNLCFAPADDVARFGAKSLQLVLFLMSLVKSSLRFHKCLYPIESQLISLTTDEGEEEFQSRALMFLILCRTSSSRGASRKKSGFAIKRRSMEQSTLFSSGWKKLQFVLFPAAVCSCNARQIFLPKKA
jgi:hypothetical protein